MIFVDTWAWIALADRSDSNHELATATHKEISKSSTKYVTSEYVVGELVTYLYRTVAANAAQKFITSVLDATETGIYEMVDVSRQQFHRAWFLRQRYRDKPDISFVDFTSMVVMQDLGITDIFSGDAHFEQVGLGFRLRP